MIGLDEFSSARIFIFLLYVCIYAFILYYIHRSSRMFIFQGPPDLMPPVRSWILYFTVTFITICCFLLDNVSHYLSSKGKKEVSQLPVFYVLGLNWFYRNFLSCVSFLQIIVIFIFGLINAFSKWAIYIVFIFSKFCPY